jgi:hypothetical protein
MAVRLNVTMAVRLNVTMAVRLNVTMAVRLNVTTSAYLNRQMKLPCSKPLIQKAPELTNLQF